MYVMLVTSTDLHIVEYWGFYNSNSLWNTREYKDISLHYYLW